MASKSSSQTRAPSLAVSERRLINPTHMQPLLYSSSTIELVFFAKYYIDYICNLLDELTLSLSRLINMIYDVINKRMVERRNMNI